MVSTERPRRIYLLTVPRCGSHLLQRMLSAQPDLEHSSYHLFQAWISSGFEEHFNGRGTLDKLTAEERYDIEDKFQEAYERMLTALDAADKAGKTAFVKEHVIMLLDPLNMFRARYPDDRGPPVVVRDPESPRETDEAELSKRTSQAILPDELLLTFKPVFQIRHPALAFPSAVRAVKGTDIPGNNKVDGAFEDIFQTYGWSRNLYEWYASRGASPLVIDADDVMNEDGAAMKKLCEATGLDADKVLTKWNTSDMGTGFEKRFLTTINSSTGILKGFSAAGIVLADEEKKWESEFGSDLAGRLSRRVQATMGDYEWLKARRL